MTDKWDQALDDLLEGRLGQAPTAGSAPADPKPPQVAVLLGPFHRPEWMAWALDQLGICGRCIKAGNLSLAVLSDPDETAWQKAAAELSQALVFSQVLAIRRGPSEDPAASDMLAFSYSGGKMIQKFPPGLLLASLDGPVEEVLLDPEAHAVLLQDAVDSWQNDWQPRFKSIESWWYRKVLPPGRSRLALEQLTQAGERSEEADAALPESGQASPGDPAWPTAEGGADGQLDGDSSGGASQ